MAEITRLFKYLEPHWAKAMVRQGAIRIGTLYDFRRQERYGVERGDEHEGIRITETDGRGGLFSGSEIPAFLRDSLDIPEGVSLLLDEGAVIRQHASSPDLFVYCACRRFSEELLDSFGAACVEITDPDAFFRAVTTHLAEHGEDGVRIARDFVLQPCVYRERREVWPDFTRYDPAFRKPPEYAHQAEVRAVWKPVAREISPLNLEIPGIVSHCCRIA